MKQIIYIIFVLCLPLVLKAQSIRRIAGESTDSLINRILDKNSFTCGIYEYTNDSNSIIIYFQIRSSKELIPDQNYYQETATIFNVLFSSDKINYTKYLIDTLGTSASCWAPANVDSILLINVDKDDTEEICIVLYHVPYCDNMLPTIDVLFYDDIDSFHKTKKFEPLSQLNFKISTLPLPPRNEIKNKIISSLKSKGLLKK